MDPLDRAEQACIVEEHLFGLRHDLRNKIASVQNATFYLRQRVEPLPLWAEDPRVRRFFDLIEAELLGADEGLERSRAGAERMHARSPTRVDASAIVRRAVERSRFTEPRDVRVTAEAATVVADPDELAVAVRFLVESAAGEAIEVTGSCRDDAYAIVVRDSAATHSAKLALQPFETAKDADAALGLSIAARIARRYGGIVLLDVASRSAIELSLPAADS